MESNESPAADTPLHSQKEKKNKLTSENKSAARKKQSRQSGETPIAKWHSSEQQMQKEGKLH